MSNSAQPSSVRLFIYIIGLYIRIYVYDNRYIYAVDCEDPCRWTPPTSCFLLCCLAIADDASILSPYIYALKTAYPHERSGIYILYIYHISFRRSLPRGFVFWGPQNNDNKSTITNRRRRTSQQVIYFGFYKRGTCRNCWISLTFFFSLSRSLPPLFSTMVFSFKFLFYFYYFFPLVSWLLFPFIFEILPRGLPPYLG